MNSKDILSLYNGDYSYIEGPAPKYKQYTENLSKCIAVQESLSKLVDRVVFYILYLLSHKKIIKHQMPYYFFNSINILS